MRRVVVLVTVNGPLLRAAIDRDLVDPELGPFKSADRLAAIFLPGSRQDGEGDHPGVRVA